MDTFGSNFNFRPDFHGCGRLRDWNVAAAYRRGAPVLLLPS